MVATVCDGQAQACAIRVARLDATGAVAEGAGNLYVTHGLISLEWEPDIADGDELELVTAAGEECLYYRADDRLRKYDLTMQMCAPEPELLEMLSGGTVHALTNVTTGYGDPGTGTIGTGVSDVSIELWVKIIVDGIVEGFARYVFPRTRRWRKAGSTHQNDVLDITLNGWAFNNPAWGDGPAGDWSDLSDEDATLHDWAIDPTVPTEADLPAPVCGAQELLVPT